MANQIYKYGTSYSGAGLSSAYSSRLNAASDRYSDASLLESSRYLTSEPAAPNYPTFDRGSTVYASQAYPASKVAGGIGASATPWASVAPAVDPALVSGVKRPAEALYHQTILGTHNAIGQSEALFSTNSLAKHPRLEIGSNLHNYPQRPGEKDCAYYMLTRTCKFGANCKFDHPLWVPEGGIPGWKEFQPIHTSESLPERPGEPDCPYYTNTQRCRFGLRCKYNHPKSAEASASGLVGENPQTVPTKQDPGSTEQDLAVKDNGVAAGESNPAKLFIPFTPALLHNSKGLPIRPGETDCSFYQKTGSCKYGSSCRYNHPDRNSINLPVAAALGQAIIPSPATNLPIGVVNQAASLLSNIDPRLAQASIAMPPTIYPQRPGQLECDFYMKTGQCKFGERCKFHHPIDRYAPTSQEHSVKLTLAGLPRREGTDACPYYMKTGACNYGVRCRYDHPPPGEAIAMAAVLGAATATGTGAGVTATEGEEDDATEDDDAEEQL